MKIGDDIFVYVSNAMIYKTKIKDSRYIDVVINKLYNYKRLEFFVQNNSSDTRKDIWIDSNKCFKIDDIETILKLDILFENILNE